MNSNSNMEITTGNDQQSQASETTNGSSASQQSSSNGDHHTPQQASGQPLIDFLQFLDDYKPSIPDSVTAHYMNSAGFAANDPRVLRLVSIASQKFIADIANDALQHCKMRTAIAQTKKGTKDKRYTLTFEDLNPTLLEIGINAKKPQYLF